MADEPKVPAPSTVDWTQNKRFIRTFATDSAAIKGEKIEMFAPPTKDPVPDAPKDALTTAIATANSDTIDLDTAGTIPPSRFATESAGTAAERLVGGTTITDAAPAPVAPPPAPPPAPAIPAPESPTPIHTYTSDFSQAVDAAHASPTSILAAEQDAGSTRARPAPAAQANTYLVIGAIALILLGAAGAYAAYRFASRPTTVAVTQVAPVRIFVDERVELSGAGSTLANAVEVSVQTPLAANAVRLLTLPNGTSTDASVFSALQFPAPNILLRNISAPASIAGVVNVSGNQSPFFILGVASYGDTFSGMLSWEPKMAVDLASIFPPYPVVETGTSTATSTPPVVATAFKDEVVANHDTRVLRDSLGHTLMIYGYWDQATLIIARDEDAFTELVSRLANSRSTQ